MTGDTGEQHSIAMSTPDAPRPLLTLDDVRKAGASGLPSDLADNSYEMLSRAACTHEDRIAIKYFEDALRHEEVRTLSYRELFRQVTRTANMLNGLGIGKGDVVALVLPNLPETHVALWGAEAAGIVMPLNPMLEAKAMSALLVAAEARVIITIGSDEVLLAKLAVALGEASTVRDVVVIGPTPGELSHQAPGEMLASVRPVNVHDFHALAAGHCDDRLETGRAIAPHDTASYFCTGGTTGLPKIAVRTHGQEMANTWMTVRMIGPALDADSVMFCGLPLFHVNAMLVTGLVPFAQGASVLLGTAQGYRNQEVIPRFWEIVERHRVTAFSAVPTLLVSLLEYSSAGYDLSSFRFAICGAAPLSAEILHRFEKTCQISISEGYGMTETASVASLNPIDGEHRPGSVGLPLPLQEIRSVVIDGDGRYMRDAEIGEPGVVAISGPNIFSGYLNPRHNEYAWFDRADGKRWLNTGDLGQLDGDGYLWLTGRAKDVIIRGGHNIDPSIIEEAFHAHPEVAIAAAIGRPDIRAGELPVAYVQLREGAQVGEEALLAFVTALITERAAIPKAVTILKKLPVTAVGKLHKPTLRHREMLEVSRAALAATGLARTAVELVSDGIGGAIVAVKVSSALADTAREALQLFTFLYRIEETEPI